MPTLRSSTTNRTRLQVLATAVAILVVAIAVAITLAVQRQDRADARPGTADIAADARVLDEAPAAKVTVTEFLDFECEACGAMHPIVDQLRRDYDGRVQFTFRYFPLPGHRNSMNAALAVEAAHQQGQLEPMYNRLFETQKQWGESRDDKSAVFRAAADDLGLDLTRYDAAITDPATRARIDRDVEAGRALGITGTPTFFINGQPITLQRTTDVENAITAALD